MNGPSEIAATALVKLYGLKALFGMLGTAMLYAALPPLTPDGRFDRREFVFRLACAGICSILLGDWVLAQLVTHAPWLQAQNHSKVVDLMTGAPGWWVTRAAALWFHKRSGKDIVEVVQEIKERA